VGALIAERLKQQDTVAYIRFASVYRDFQDVEAFRSELETLGAKDPKLQKPKKQESSRTH
jgi:transcriptional repressor NrdR